MFCQDRYVHVNEDGVPYTVGNFNLNDIVRLVSAVMQDMSEGKTNQINWPRVAQLIALPELECRRVWKYINKQHKAGKPVFSEQADHDLLEVNVNEPSDVPQMTVGAQVFPSFNPPNTSNLPAVSGHNELENNHLEQNEDKTEHKQHVQPLSQAELELLTEALAFHGPEWDYIQRKYMPSRSQRSIKQLYIKARKEKTENPIPTERDAFKKDVRAVFGITKPIGLSDLQKEALKVISGA